MELSDLVRLRCLLACDRFLFLRRFADTLNKEFCGSFWFSMYLNSIAIVI